MVAISQTTFSLMKIFEFRFKFSDSALAPIMRQAIIWTNDGIIYSFIYASPGLNELKLLNELFWRIT